VSSSDFDILVCGGGVAGAAAASLLAAQSHRVGLIDNRVPAAELPQAEYDPRVVAISPGSQAILAAAGGWARLDLGRLGPYDRMQVHSGARQIEFKASEHGLPMLGWIAEISALQLAQWQALEAHKQVRILAPARLADVALRPDRVRVELDDGRVFRTALLVAADGARSRLRQQAGIAMDEWHYNQHALVTHVATEQPNPGIAWQRFTEHGPLALLPLADGRSSIVWSQASGRVRQLMALDDEAFIDALNQCQDSPFGPATACATRHAIPLVRRKARSLALGRLVLLGDAARSVHPLAGQGLNLGLADAAALAEVLEGWQAGVDPATALARYQRWRLGVGAAIGGGIHTINELAHGPAGLGRSLLGLGFGTAARLWPLREAFVQRACGIDSDSPRLARGPGSS
jgi:ubiquinone biosynthesis UbiH/UbiF/VisC/COQ6 family hydroxylase